MIQIVGVITPALINQLSNVFYFYKYFKSMYLFYSSFKELNQRGNSKILNNIVRTYYQSRRILWPTNTFNVNTEKHLNVCVVLKQ